MSLESAGDRQIIERVLEGDTNSFNLLVWQWEKPIFNYIYRLVGDADEAMDLCQESFMKAFRELGSLKDRDRFSSWLYRIAHNVCYSRFRKDSGKTFVRLESDLGTKPLPIENRLAVEKALRGLPDDQREVVVLKVFQGMKFEEIAAVQGAPVSTVKSRLYMSFKKLKSILSSEPLNRSQTSKAGD